ANMDGSVDFFDLSQVLGYNYNGGTPGTYTDGDLNYDGVTDFFDLAVVLSANYNGAPFSAPAAASSNPTVAPPPSGAAPVPAARRAAPSPRGTLPGIGVDSAASLRVSRDSLLKKH